jgi:hypothetical protein
MDFLPLASNSEGLGKFLFINCIPKSSTQKCGYAMNCDTNRNSFMYYEQYNVLNRNKCVGVKQRKKRCTWIKNRNISKKVVCNTVIPWCFLKPPHQFPFEMNSESI